MQRSDNFHFRVNDQFFGSVILLIEEKILSRREVNLKSGKTKLNHMLEKISDLNIHEKSFKRTRIYMNKFSDA